MLQIYMPAARDNPSGVAYYRLLASDPGKSGLKAMFDLPFPGAIPVQHLFHRIPDRSTNTFLVIAAAEGTVWTKPDEPEYGADEKYQRI